MGFIQAGLMAQQIKNPAAMQKTREAWAGSLGWENSLEKGMATHSSILAWKIPWAEKPGRLQSKGSDMTATEHAWLHIYTHTKDKYWD